jgi:hypothetical protein
MLTRARPTIAVEVGEIGRFARPEQLVSYGRLAPRVRQSGQARLRSGPLSKSGSRVELVPGVGFAPGLLGRLDGCPAEQAPSLAPPNCSPCPQIRK